MSVKVIDYIPYEKVEDKRRESLKRDIREIIDNRIVMCEITEPQYPNSTMRDQFRRAMRSVIREYVKYTEDGNMKFPNMDAFTIRSKNIDGTIHWYVKFNADIWWRYE